MRIFLILIKRCPKRLTQQHIQSEEFSPGFGEGKMIS